MLRTMDGRAWTHLAKRHYGVTAEDWAAEAELAARSTEPHEDADARRWLVEMAADGLYAPLPALAKAARAWPMHRVGGGGGEGGGGEGGVAGEWEGAGEGGAIGGGDGEPAPAPAPAPTLTLLVLAADLAAARAAAALLEPIARRTDTLLRDADEGVRRSPPHVRLLYVDLRSLRHLPSEPGAALLPQHVNGGLAMPAQRPSVPVLVYRREDARKVAVHELVHAHGLDAALHGHPSAEAAAVRAFGVRMHGAFTRSVGLGEAYVEALACFLFAAHADLGASPGRRSGTAALERASKRSDAIARRVLAHFGRHAMLAQHDYRVAVATGRAHPPSLQQQLPVPVHAIVEGTHAVAYVLARAALMRPNALRDLLGTYPPGTPPADAAEFFHRVARAAAAWDGSQKSHALQGGDSLAFE